MSRIWSACTTGRSSACWCPSGGAVGMRVEEFYPIGRRSRIRLHKKGGKFHELPAHHNLDAWLHEYIETAGVAEERKSPLIRSAKGRAEVLSDRPLLIRNALDLVRRRAHQAGILGDVYIHSFRATEITAYPENGGTLAMTHVMAAHESPRTTKLYDGTSDAVSRDEMERIIL